MTTQGDYKRHKANSLDGRKKGSIIFLAFPLFFFTFYRSAQGTGATPFGTGATPK